MRGPEENRKQDTKVEERSNEEIWRREDYTNTGARQGFELGIISYIVCK